MKKMTVIVPAYNTAEYIKGCVESLVNQTLKELEVIIVDDGSKDNTLQILKEYEKQYPDRLRVLHKENGGQASARNMALEYAEGEYVGFVDSDDWVDLDMYERMYQKAKEEDADIVVCNMVEHAPGNDILHGMTHVSTKLRLANSSCNKIFRRELAEGVTFPEGLWYEDFEYSAKQLMKAERVSLIHDGLYHYNHREGSTMHNNNAHKNKDIITVLDHISAFAEENGWTEKYKEELEYLYLEHVLYTTIQRLQEQENPEKKKVIDDIRKAVLKKYPDFHKTAAFQEYGKRKRIIVYLNAKGFSHLVPVIFGVKGFIRKILGAK